MNRENPNEKWKRLTRLARETSPAQEQEMPAAPPVGLATRIAARWSGSSAKGPGPLDLLERAGWFGAALAIVLCALLVTLGSPNRDRSEPLAFDELLFAPEIEPGPGRGGGLF